MFRHSIFHILNWMSTVGKDFLDLLRKIVKLLRYSVQHSVTYMAGSQRQLITLLTVTRVE